MKHIGWPEYAGTIELGANDEEHVTLARLFCGYDELARELGGRPDSLLEEVGICPSTLASPSARVPVRALGQLLENTAQRLGCADLGLRLAECQAMETIMQPLDRLICAAPTIRDALESCVRHVGAYNSGLIMEMDDDWPDGLHLLDFKLVDGLSLFPQMMEQLLLLSHNSIIWLSAGFARSRVVWFSHLNVSPPVAYARRFNAVIKFGQEYDGIFFSDADLAARLTECNADIFAAEARTIAERFPARQDIATQVRQTVFRILTQSDSCTRQHVARLLGFQERTLNRHLSRNGTSFEAIRDDVRKNLAFRYLARADLSLTEIAGRLGYSELAVLSRCCRRWFGSSPRQLRQHLLSARTAANSPRAPSEHPRRLVA